MTHSSPSSRALVFSEATSTRSRAPTSRSPARRPPPRAEQVALLLLGAEAVQRADHDQGDAVGADRDLAARGLLQEQGRRRGSCRQSRRTRRGSAGPTSPARPSSRPARRCGGPAAVGEALTFSEVPSRVRSRGWPRRSRAARRSAHRPPDWWRRSPLLRLHRFARLEAVQLAQGDHHLCTSSGSVGDPQPASPAHIEVSGASSDIPSAPCTSSRGPVPPGASARRSTSIIR